MGLSLSEPRALTNRERARIQSFPDDFEFLGKFGEIRRQIGNAVPPVGIIGIVNRLNALFEGNYKKVNLDGLHDFMLSMPTKTKLSLAKSKDEVDWLELSKI